MSKNGDIIAERLREWLPDPLHTLIIHADRLVFIVDTRKEPGIEAHLSKQARVGIGVSERVNVPANSWDSIITKLTHEEFVANHHIVHHVIMVSASFVMHRPSGVNEFEAAFFDELPHIIFLLIRLLIPPHGEEFHLNLGEALLFVGHKLNDISVDDVLNIGCLNILTRPSEVLVRGLKPADIIMAVRHQVYVQVIILLLEVILKVVNPVL